MIYQDLLRRATGSAIVDVLAPQLRRLQRVTQRLDRRLEAWQQGLRENGLREPARLRRAQLKALDRTPDALFLEALARRARHHVRRRGHDAAAEWVTSIMAALPEDEVAKFYAGYSAVRKMDYAKHDIYLLYTSPFIRIRLRSCEKEPFTVDWVEQFVKPGDVFYDIGANVGAYSLVAAKHTDGQARIFAFEPSFPTFRDLCRNVLLNGCEGSITPLPIAVWHRNRLKTFHYTTLDAGAAKHGIHLEADSLNSVYRERVLAFRLDELKSVLKIPRPNHIKIDVDGPELKVLRGAHETLSDPNLRSIIVEIQRKAGPDLMETSVGKLLESKGFRLQSQHRRDKVKAPNYGVFVRDEMTRDEG